MNIYLRNNRELRLLFWKPYLRVYKTIVGFEDKVTKRNFQKVTFLETFFVL